jgi:hypothetical protein
MWSLLRPSFRYQTSEAQACDFKLKYVNTECYLENLKGEEAACELWAHVRDR